MSYNKETLPHYMKTAGKISVFAAIAGLAVFLFAFMVDIGQQEFQRVSAQTASTSLTVLNTPPEFTVDPYEVTPSATSTPTNSGDVITWEAVGTDSNDAPYFLLVCAESTPVPVASSSPIDGLSLGTAPPSCGSGVIQWGVSTSTVSGELASVSTTTSEAAGSQFAELNEWYAWVCDDDPTQPACNLVASQGSVATGSSPFNMNRRPVLVDAANNGPVDPSSALNFTTTSNDPDSVGGDDDLSIVICQTAGFDTVTDTCIADFLASTSVTAISNVGAGTTTPSIIRDGTYPAFVYLIDEHGHEANPNGTSTPFTINNVAPTVLGGDIILNGGADLELTVPGGTTTGFTIDFIASDANSCVNTSNVPGSEIPGFEVAVQRFGSVATSSCNPQAGDYDPNDCYTNGVDFSTWQLTCTASSTTCTGPADDSIAYECTFPLWFLADATDNGTIVSPFETDTWIAAVAAGDDQFATSSRAASAGVELLSFSSLDLITAEIPYGALAPGSDTGSLLATTTILNVGNTGLDQEVDGSAMCPTFSSTSSDCTLNATSTVFTSNQEFGTSALPYGSGTALPTTSVAVAELELDVNKTTVTTTPETGVTFWGIAVPSAISVAGSYTGLNTFIARTAETLDW